MTYIHDSTSYVDAYYNMQRECETLDMLEDLDKLSKEIDDTLEEFRRMESDLVED